MSPILPFLLGALLLVSATAQATPPRTNDLRNTAPVAPTPDVHVPVQPGQTVILPDAPVAPGTVQVTPDTTVVVPDASSVMDIPAAERPSPVVDMPAANATQPASLRPLSPMTNATRPVLPTTNATQPAPLRPLSPMTNATQPASLRPLSPMTNATRPVPEQKEGVLPVQPALQQPLTPADFLVKTQPGIKEPKKQPAPPVKKAEKPSEPPVQTKVPPKTPPKTPEVPPVTTTKSAKNEPLMIPEDAKKTGKLDFLEGCWKGTRPEYNTKRIITERFCFNDRGVGKRTIDDPRGGLVCVGPTLASMGKDGSLYIRSEKALCLSGEEWGAAEMLCTGEGNSTPCSWEFPDVNTGARQSYTIRFVRD